MVNYHLLPTVNLRFLMDFRAVRSVNETIHGSREQRFPYYAFPTMTEPKASRPHMPGYGIPTAQGGRGLLPWSWAVERLSAARNYWIGTTCPDGRPHAMPVWGVWLEGRLLFSTGSRSRKARNLAADPRCVVHPDSDERTVILEGVAEKTTDPALLKQFKEAYGKKYQWNMDDFAEPVYAVRPRVAFGFIGITGEFVGSATRWVFE